MKKAATFFLFVMVVVITFVTSLGYAKHGDIWKGALIGAGTAIVGGKILDAMTQEPVQHVTVVQPMQPVDAYQSGYQDGFNNGYKAGYTSGYKDGIRDESRQHD